MTLKSQCANVKKMSHISTPNPEKSTYNNIKWQYQEKQPINKL